MQKSWALIAVVLCCACAGFGSRAQDDTVDLSVANPQLVKALGWPQSARAHDAAQSEIRLWLDHGLVVPQEAVRIVKKGDRISAEMVRWWPNDPEMLRSIDPRSGRTFADLQERDCPDLRKSKNARACIVRLDAAIAARAYADLDRLGVWNLQKPRVPEDGPIAVSADGEGLVVELLQPHDHRQMRFASNPADVDYTPAAAAVAQVATRLISGEK